MKTLTEFDGFSLKNAHAKKQELVGAGKTAEELPQALGEALKVEGDRLTYLLSALELIEGKPEGIKRVVVYAVEEGKPAPKGTVQKGEKHFLAEYFFVPQAKRPDREGRHGRGGRDGGGKGKKRGRGRGGRGGTRGERAGRPGPEGLQAAEGTGGGSEAGRENKRRPRPNRAKRPPGALPNVKPVSQNATSSQASVATEKQNENSGAETTSS